MQSVVRMTACGAQVSGGKRKYRWRNRRAANSRPRFSHGSFDDVFRGIPRAVDSLSSPNFFFFPHIYSFSLSCAIELTGGTAQPKPNVFLFDARENKVYL